MRTRKQGTESRDQAARSPQGCTRAGSVHRAAALCAVILLAPIVLSPTLYAESPAPDAHAVAHLVDSHYNKLHSLRARFTESYEGLGMVRNESGTLLLLKPGRMRWDYTSPAGKVFLIDGKFAWFYAQGSAQVQRIPAKQLDDLRSPLRFLLGHTQLEKELTGLRLSTGAHGNYVLTGQPSGQENRVRRVTLTIAPKTGSIVGIEIEETDGAITGFTFNDEEMNAAIPERTFHFTPPAGIPVVDSAPPV
jgi:outer membrane lipoprotein carrier protein